MKKLCAWDRGALAAFACFVLMMSAMSAGAWLWLGSGAGVGAIFAGVCGGLVLGGVMLAERSIQKIRRPR